MLSVRRRQVCGEHRQCRVQRVSCRVLLPFGRSHHSRYVSRMSWGNLWSRSRDVEQCELHHLRRRAVLGQWEHHVLLLPPWYLQ